MVWYAKTSFISRGYVQYWVIKGCCIRSKKILFEHKRTSVLLIQTLLNAKQNILVQKKLGTKSLLL